MNLKFRYYLGLTIFINILTETSLNFIIYEKVNHINDRYIRLI